MRYVGACQLGGWGTDLVGMLLCQDAPGDGWYLAASHISSDPGWSQHDIYRHFVTHSYESCLFGPYEWVGLMPRAQMRETYPPAPDPYTLTQPGGAET